MPIKLRALDGTSSSPVLFIYIPLYPFSETKQNLQPFLLRHENCWLVERVMVMHGILAPPGEQSIASIMAIAMNVTSSSPSLKTMFRVEGNAVCRLQCRKCCLRWN